VPSEPALEALTCDRCGTDWCAGVRRWRDGQGVMWEMCLTKPGDRRIELMQAKRLLERIKFTFTVSE